MKVCIFDEGFIPGLGRGPFRTPIEVTEDMYALYKRMGLKVINATKNVSIAESGIINRNKSIKKENTVDIIEKEEIKPTVKEVTEETIVEETVEEVTEEEVEETVEEVTEEEVTEEEVEVNNLTKKELIELLTENGIECNNNMTKSQLIKLFEEN